MLRWSGFGDIFPFSQLWMETKLTTSNTSLQGRKTMVCMNFFLYRWGIPRGFHGECNQLMPQERGFCPRFSPRLEAQV